MNGREQSDRRVVPKKRANNDHGAPWSAEPVEERRLAKGNPDTGDSHRAQYRSDRLRNDLDRIRQVAKRDREVKFTSLWHHVHNIDRLREAYFSLARKAAAGIDGVTWKTYGEDLNANLVDLNARLRRGAYRAQPVKRVNIPKPDGRNRPIGVPTLEDKIVQRATVEVLNAIYEEDFMGFSYGFRPARGAHDALDAVWVGVMRKRVNWVLDADIRGFFDTIDHGWLMKFVEHRIADPNVLRHIKKWLRAGVMEEGEWREVREGTPQGGSISPLLANIYLHYVLDLWADHKRRVALDGEAIIVRYADDFVMGFEDRAEAEWMLEQLKVRLGRFNLALHPDKTRLLEFGRFADSNRSRRGKQGKPETFDFLGFTHVCGKSKKGGYLVLRRTSRPRALATLARIKAGLRQRMHASLRATGRWLARVLAGYYRYYAVPGNTRPLWDFYHQVIYRWRKVLGRRSQRSDTRWIRMGKLAADLLPTPRVHHPWPSARLCV